VIISPLCRTLIVGMAGRYFNERDDTGELKPTGCARRGAGRNRPASSTSRRLFLPRAVAAAADFIADHADATPMLDQPELYTDIGPLITGDFITEVVNTYMPEAQMWCERLAGEGFEEAFEDIKDEVKAQDKKIFGAIKASNLYSELPKAFNPDLVIAGAGLWVNRPLAHMPIECLAVPMREMEINLGPDGEIDDRFVVRYSYNKYVATLLGEAIYNKIDAEIARSWKASRPIRTRNLGLLAQVGRHQRRGLAARHPGRRQAGARRP
jgi:hypothetical protein